MVKNLPEKSVLKMDNSGLKMGKILQFNYKCVMGVSLLICLIMDYWKKIRKALNK